MRKFNLYFLFLVLIVGNACSPAVQLVATPTLVPPPTPLVDPADEAAQESAPTPAPEEIIFNRRATGSGSARVDGEPYTFEMFLCGWSVVWSDEAYPQNSEETAFYGDDLGANAQFRGMGAGVQEDGAIFIINFSKDYFVRAASASITRIVENNPTQGWSYSEERYSIDRIVLDEGHISSPEPLGFFNKDDVSTLVWLNFDATCESYGGTFDTVPALMSEVIGVPLPEPGLGSFVLDGQSYQFNPEVCGVFEEQAVAKIKGEGEQDGERYTLDLDMSGEFSLLSLTFRDPVRRLDPGTITDIPLTIEGSRVYSSGAIELRELTSPENPLHTLSLDITCP